VRHADVSNPTTGEARCPICRAPTEPHFRPFCSRRCADVDLLRWLRGGYAIPVAAADDDEDGDGSRPAGASSSERGEGG
jgi:endogenous inhibitor of DNA gyrase (YacG/DUF329 family)